MTKEDVLDIIRESLTVEVDYKKSMAYFDMTTLRVRILLDGEILSESTEYIYD